MKHLALCICILFTVYSYGQFELLRKTGHALGIKKMDISNNGKYFLTLDGERCFVWDVATGAQINRIEDISDAKFSADGESIYTVSNTKIFRHIDHTGKKISILSETPYNKSSAPTVFYPSDEMLINGWGVFNMKNGLIRNLSYDGWGTGQDYSPAKKILAVADRQNPRIGLIELPSGMHKGYLNTDIKQRYDKKIQFSFDGRKILIYAGDTLQVISTETGKVLRTFKGRGDHNISFAVFDKTGNDVIWFSADLTLGRIFRSIISTGETVWERKMEKDAIRNEGSFAVVDLIAKISDNGNHLLVASPTSDQILLDPSTGKTIKTFRKIPAPFIWSLYQSSDNAQFTVRLSNDHIVWNLETGEMEDTSRIKSFAINADNEFYYDSQGSDFVKIGKNKETVPFKYPGEFKRIHSFGNGAYDFMIQTATAATKRLCKEKEPSDIIKITDAKTRKLLFTRNCNWIAAEPAYSQPMIAIREQQNINEINFYNFLTSKKLFSINSTAMSASTDMTFSPDDNYMVVASNDYGIVIFDLTKKISYVADKTELGLTPNRYYKIAGFTPDSKYAVVYQESGYVKFVDISNGKLHPKENIKLPSGGYNFRVAFSKNGQFILIAGQSGVIRVFDRTTQAEVAQLYPFPETNDWAVLTPSGRFDANKGALNTMYFKSTNNIAPLGTVFEKYYTPKLLSRILNGEKFETIPEIIKLKAAPIVTVQFKESNRNLFVEDDPYKTIETKVARATITVKADCPADKISEIRLYHNEKLVETTRNLVVEDANAESSVTKTFNVILNAGSNIFRAVALNSERTESKPAFINAKLIAENKPSPTQRAITQLHLIVVGINTYKNAKYNLNYANADASSFKTAIELGAKEIFSTVNTYYISDNAATKDGIQSALEKVKLNAQPDDLLVFYYAGHGVVDDKKEFYLVPHDVTQLYGNDQGLRKSAISSSMIQSYSKDIKAQKQLFILDACQSAGALDNVVAMRGAAEEKAIAQLARSTGTHWLTASGSNQFASEFSQLGHGSFTYCLLEALKGKADNGDKKLTVKEIDAYLQSVVPEITKKYKGTAQYPASFGYGNDFPVIIIK